MLLRFGVSNYRSINKYQEFSLASTSLKDEPSLTFPGRGVEEMVLPVIGIYGANASGKSNILRAFRFMVDSILMSHTKGAATGGFPRRPFELDKKSAEEPTQLDCDFIFENIRYHYGFSINSKIVIEEWLYAFPSNRRQVWFHRKQDEKQPYYFSDKYMKGKNKTIESLTRGNSLFLSSAAQNNHEILTPIYNYFKNNYVFRLHQMIASSANVPEFMEDDKVRSWILNFLSTADTGISDIKITEFDMPNEAKPFINDIKAVLDKYINNDEKSETDILVKLQENKIKNMSIGHQSVGGEVVYLKLEDESRGTLSLISILGPVFLAIKNGYILVVDEIESSMHSLLSQKIIELFTSEHINKNGAQLIFTTHDTNLLCDKCLRRDEVWFTEKDKSGGTNLYPLTDIRTRNTDNLEKGYLQGRFGAIPFLGNFKDMTIDCDGVGK